MLKVFLRPPITAEIIAVILFLCFSYTDVSNDVFVANNCAPVIGLLSVAGRSMTADMTIADESNEATCWQDL